MSEEILVKVDNVSKKYCRTLKRSLWYGVQDITQEILGNSSIVDTLRTDEFWAVKDVSFELKRGECLGLIGQNGAGKSTVLKMLNGLIKPEAGTITMRGKVGALIELGAGFNPILTGRENIYINGSVLGLTKKEIDNKLSSIIDFAEIEEFIDSPVQNYSSGMKVRLGFAIAIHTEPDVLIIDEVLAVGDMGFVIKCVNKIYSIMDSTAMIFVSHNMPLIYRVCNKLILMDGGQVKYQGDNVSEGIDDYYAQFEIPNQNYVKSKDALLNNITINEINVMNYSSPIQVERLKPLVLGLELDVNKSYRDIDISIIFFDRELRAIATVMRNTKQDNIVNNTGNIKLKISLSSILFSKGIFSITLAILDLSTRKVLLRQQEAAYFQVISEHEVWTPFELEGELKQLN